MNGLDFVKSIYLGDRACKSIKVDGWNSKVSIQVDLVSRIRSESGDWEYYTEEDIENGVIFLDRVEKVLWDPGGLIPNDRINMFTAAPVEGGLTLFTLSADSVDDSGKNVEASIKVLAEAIYLVDPLNPHVPIYE